jgi:hypothetical protein
MADTATLEALGFSKEEIANRVVDKIVAGLTQNRYEDEDGERWFGDSEFKQGIDRAVRERIDAEVTRVANEHIAPRVAELIEGATLQQTNQWGEKRGEAVSFIEYLVQRADAYMAEPVSFDGKTKAESNGYGWSAKTTRLSYAIDRHLQYSIDTAMKKVLSDANAHLGKNLNDAVKIALGNLTVQVKTEVRSA